MNTLTLEHQTFFSLMIYEDNYAYVEDIRTVNPDFPSGIVQYQDFIPGIQLKTLQVEGAFIQVQRTQMNDFSEMEILKRSIGKEVWFKEDGGDSPRRVKLIEYSGRKKVLLDIEEQVYLFNPIGQFTIPMNFLEHTKPFIQWKFTDLKKGLTIRYLTQGFSWEMHYYLTVQEDGFQLKALCSIENQTSHSLKSIPVFLASGIENKTNNFRVYSQMEQIGSSSEVKTFEVGGHHVLKLPETVDLYPHEEVNIGYINRTGKTIKHDYYATSKNNQIVSKYRFENSKENGLGIVLPKGRIHLSHEGDFTSYLGEKSFEKTMENGWVYLDLGASKDISIRSNERYCYDEDDYYVYEVEVVFSNHVDRPVNVDYTHFIDTNSWHIIDCNIKYDKNSHSTANFTMDLGALETNSLKFTYCKYETV
ncbi:hypothetical protein [Planomicrobium okeanokoites]|uniref:hypothetical protein n=1 Tax=Planomicrobium okeanokoites TaxID=244 RepID=UPI0024908BD3|nr:hypothetical protein [Planomicrobium okeanokoites]